MLAAEAFGALFSLIKLLRGGGGSAVHGEIKGDRI
jgi:hypothetical protein